MRLRVLSCSRRYGLDGGEGRGPALQERDCCWRDRWRCKSSRSHNSRRQTLKERHAARVMAGTDATRTYVNSKQMAFSRDMV